MPPSTWLQDLGARHLKPKQQLSFSSVNTRARCCNASPWKYSENNGQGYSESNSGSFHRVSPRH
jgi:hypothetical protein